MNKPQMICPDGGVEMNDHAMKIDHSADDTTLIDPAFGGVVQEAHSCPEFGRTSLRQA